MRLFVGMILGCALTILIVYMHDNVRISTTSDSAQITRPIVNWDVAADEWANMQHNVRVAWDRLTGSIERART